jgi:hypothetical protein
MPILLPSTDLRPGMRLSRPLVFKGRLLLPAGQVLDRRDLDLLRRLHWNLQAYIADPVLDQLIVFEDDSRSETVSRVARREVVRAVRQVYQQLGAVGSLDRMDLWAAESAVAKIAEFLGNNSLACRTLQASGEGITWADRAGNVFFLAMVLGNAIRGCLAEAARQKPLAARSGQRTSPPALIPLGLAAIFMNVSLWSGYGQLDHPGPLTAAERDMVFRHPLASADLLPDSIDPHVRAAILAHHENHNGTGYPRQLRARDIPLFARILRIADAFSAATITRPYRDAQSPARTCWEMTCSPLAALYDPVVLKVFQATVQPYPIGGRVQLACGRQAVVVRFGRHHGLLPEIVIAYDDQGKPLPRPRIEGPYRLDQHPELRIASFRGENLSDVYDSSGLAPFPELPVPAEFSTLADAAYP